MFILTPQSVVPIYRQIQEQVRRMVASGRLAAGEPLPSVREVAAQHAINPITILKAYSLLEAEGLIQRNRGKNMTVAGTRPNQAPVAKRVQQIERQVAELVLASKQLELSKKDVFGLIDTTWGDSDE